MPDLKYWRQYYDRDYWENGPATGKSNYANWEIFEIWDDKFIDHFDKVIPLQGKKFLDVGCALGHIINALLKRGIEAYGMDLSQYAIDKGQRTHPILKGHTVCCSAHELPYPDETFDVIHSNQVFEHIPEELVPAMLHEIQRVMKPGSVAWIGLACGEGPKPEDNPDHITMKPLEWWKEQIEDSGFIWDMSVDEAFRATGLDYFREYNWHSFSFRKKDAPAAIDRHEYAARLMENTSQGWKNDGSVL